MSLHLRESGNWGWERKHPVLPGGRISVSLRTADKKEATRRERALDLLLEQGEIAVLQRLRSGELHIVQVVAAVRDGAVMQLRNSSALDLSMGAMVDRVLATKEATRSEGTQRIYRDATRLMLRRWPREKSIIDIPTDEIRSWLYEPKGKRKRAWAPNTQRQKVMVGGYMWRLAIGLESEAAERLNSRPRLTRDPWGKVEIDERPASRQAFLEPPEWKVLLNHAMGLPEAALLAVMCLAGLRIGEAQNLRTSIDVDLSAGLIHVQARDGDFSWRPKNMVNSQRDVPIAASLLPILDDHITRGYAGDRFFFHADRWDKPMSYSLAKKLVRLSLERAGLKYGAEGELTAHSLRHTFASWLVREGWSSTLVAKLMGNDPKEVDRTYAHLQSSDLTKVVATLDRLTV